MPGPYSIAYWTQLQVQGTECLTVLTFWFMVVDSWTSLFAFLFSSFFFISGRNFQPACNRTSLPVLAGVSSIWLALSSPSWLRKVACSLIQSFHQFLFTGLPSRLSYQGCLLWAPQLSFSPAIIDILIYFRETPPPLVLLWRSSAYLHLVTSF